MSSTRTREGVGRLSKARTSGMRWSALALAIATAHAVHAQSPTPEPSAAPAGEEIVVTGSRIRSTTGMDSPNPVTVVTPEQLSVMAPTNLIEGLAELPQFYGSATTQTPSPFFTSTGAGSLNLRGLQSNRTLQLLDGRRVVESTIFGGPDINLFPENVIKTRGNRDGRRFGCVRHGRGRGRREFHFGYRHGGPQGQPASRRERERRQPELQGFRRRRLRRGQGKEDPHTVERREGATGSDLEHRRPPLRLVQGACADQQSGRGRRQLAEQSVSYYPQRRPRARLRYRRHFLSADRGRRAADSRQERHPFAVRPRQSLQQLWLLHDEWRLGPRKRRAERTTSRRIRAGKTHSSTSSTISRINSASSASSCTAKRISRS